MLVGHAAAGQVPVSCRIDIEERCSVKEVHLGVRDGVDDLAELALPPREGLGKAGCHRAVVERRQRLTALCARQDSLATSRRRLEQRRKCIELKKWHIARDGQRIVRFDLRQAAHQAFHRAPALHAVFDEHQAIALSDILQGRRPFLHAEAALRKGQGCRPAREPLEQPLAII